MFEDSWVRLLMSQQKFTEFTKGIGKDIPLDKVLALKLRSWVELAEAKDLKRSIRWRRVEMRVWGVWFAVLTYMVFSEEFGGGGALIIASFMLLVFFLWGAFVVSKTMEKELDSLIYYYEKINGYANKILEESGGGN